MATHDSTPGPVPQLSREVLGKMYQTLDASMLKLWGAVAIIDSVALALKAHIGTDWPASIPYFPDALRTVASMITDVAADEMHFYELDRYATQDTDEVSHV